MTGIGEKIRSKKAKNKRRRKINKGYGMMGRTDASSIQMAGFIA
jgi:hypothetical protein